MTSIHSFTTALAGEYRDLDEVNGGFRSFADLIVTQGDHIEYGHDFSQLLQAYQLEGVVGISEWFGELARDFTSPEGLPLPFAEALQQVTGIPVEQAADWLSANLVDVVELGTDAAITAFFRKNPKIFSAGLVLGIGFGLYSDNPLLIAVNGIQYFCTLRREGRLQNGIWNKADRFARASFAVVDRVCTATFIADTALDFAGVNLPELAGKAAGMLESAGQLSGSAQAALEAASAVDWVEGIGNFGLSLLVGKAVGKVINWLNDDVKKELLEANSLLELRHQLYELLRKEVPPESLMPVVEMLINGDAYSPVLPRLESSPAGQGSIHSGTTATGDIPVKESGLQSAEGIS